MQGRSASPIPIPRSSPAARCTVPVGVLHGWGRRKGDKNEHHDGERCFRLFHPGLRPARGRLRGRTGPSGWAQTASGARNAHGPGRTRGDHRPAGGRHLGRRPTDRGVVLDPQLHLHPADRDRLADRKTRIRIHARCRSRSDRRQRLRGRLWSAVEGNWSPARRRQPTSCGRRWPCGGAVPTPTSQTSPASRTKRAG